MFFLEFKWNVSGCNENGSKIGREDNKPIIPKNIPFSRNVTATMTMKQVSLGV